MGKEQNGRKGIEGKAPEQTSLTRAERRARQRRLRSASVPPHGITRRDFMKQAGAAGALVGLPLLAPNARADDDDVVESDDLRSPRGRKTRHTLFFNLSHVGGAATTHYLHLGGRKYRLERVRDRPQVLAKERQSNAFLRAVRDDQITHHVVGVAAAVDTVTMAYWTCNENAQQGTWEMTGMHVNIPPSAFGAAYQSARQLTPSGPLPLSGKRRKYGVRAARTVRDMREEQVLVDTTSFAEAVVGVHPDLLSVIPAKAAHIQTHYLSRGTDDLSDLLSTKGPAAPEGLQNISGAPPWATLRPLIDDKTGKPFKRKSDGLNQYYPEWGSDVGESMARSVASLHPRVKDDDSLGIDVTSYNLNNANSRPSDAQLAGRCWARRDGIPTVEKSNIASPAVEPTLTFVHQSTNTGLVVTNPDFARGNDGRIHITLDNVSNWFLRYLGVWIQFFDANDVVIPVDKLPADTYSTSDPNYDPHSDDKPDALFLGIVPGPLAVGGVPLWPGSFSPTVKMPLTAHRMRVFYTGLGLSGSEPKDPANIYTHGALMTMIFNYGVVGLFMCAGASNYSGPWKLGIGVGGGAIATAVATIIGQVENQGNFVKGLAAFTMGFMKVLLQTGNNKAITVLVETILEEIAEAEVEDAIPVAGQIAQAVAVVVGVIQLAETSIELAISPPACIYDCVFTHNLSVTFLPDKNNTQFPQPPANARLYYKVSYLFDTGTAHTQDAVYIDPTVKSIAITFTNIPFGGQVNVSIGFYVKRDSTPEGQNDWCAGNASTGLVSNTVDEIPPPTGLTGFHITEIKIPITSTTLYIHTRKTSLDASGSHLWATDPDGTHAPPYVQPPNSSAPSLGDFTSITVRQGTAEQQGFVGYAWQAFSTDINGCGGPAPGQFDQMATLNTDAGNNGANAQIGYANSQDQHLCGLPHGVRMGYNLLTQNAVNMYLDTTSGMIRPVTLDPAGFPGPTSNQSFGMLNLDSTRCLLHPAGHIVSINNEHHKIETLKLPTCVENGVTRYCVQSDAEAEAYYLARTHAGMGLRAGLIHSPIAAAISPDGVIFVLEDGNNRIQAFDIGGNPVPYFRNQSPSKYFLELTATEDNEYLDLAVEFTGYLYVLSKDDNNVHRLDIYHPTQVGTNPICTTPNMNAAKLTVDFWRNVYSLNYEVLRLPNGNIPGFTEPSVSLWVPPPPPPPN